MPEQIWPQHSTDNSVSGDTKALSEAAQEPQQGLSLKPSGTLTEGSRKTENSSIPNRAVLKNSSRSMTNFAHQLPASFLSRHWYEGRRRKAAVMLTLIWSITITLHFLSWGFWFVVGLTGLLSIHALRMLLTPTRALPEAQPDDAPEQWPFVSLLVAAKNEEAVIENLVKNLCNLDYPSSCYELWVINDNSSDRTSILLDQLVHQYKQLKVIHRGADATGGKSGALNQVVPATRGEFLGVFDADAQVTPDLLRRVIPLFQSEQVGAVQVRKAIANTDKNFWTRAQAAEMALDTFFQRQRIAMGGIGELRGNGQFVRRTALERCGGWNEETITDDLDLTVRLHLDRWDIDVLEFPPVFEEGVTHLKALWHQRSRWAEGGYQRYLDYWPFILRNRMGTQKTLDLLAFWIIQYVLPTAAVPDVLTALFLRRLPITTPLTVLSVTLSGIGMFAGLRRIQQQNCIHRLSEQSLIEASPNAVLQESSNAPNPIESFSLLWMTLFQTFRGTVYMLHWLFVVGSTTARISIRPKRLKWVKTVHQGSVTVE